MSLKKVFKYLMIMGLVMTLVACNPTVDETVSDEVLIQEAKSALNVSFTVSGDTLNSVTGMLILPTIQNEIAVTWTSDSPLVLSHTGVVTRQELDVEVLLTATLVLNEKTDNKEFNIIVKARPVVIDYGQVFIDDITLYMNSNRVSTFEYIEPEFTKETMKETLSYSVISGDSRMIMIDENEMVVAKMTGNGTVRVKAESNNFSTEFNVHVVYHNYNDPDFTYFDRYNIARFDVNGSRLKLKDLPLGDYTVVIGDSFTADRFIGSFLTTFSADKYIINAGISSTTSYHWEAAFSHIIGSVAPKNIVLNIGTNNFYDLNASVNDTRESIQRLLKYMHSKYPSTNIYFFGISQRTNTMFKTQVTDANLQLKNFCDSQEYLTFVDANLLSSDLSDGIHPNQQGYTKMFDALLLSGIEILDK